MTLMNIISAALRESGYGTDSQAMETYKQQYTVYVNDGMRDIADALKLRTTENIEVIGGEIDVDNLSKECVKVLSVRQNGAAVSFAFGPSSDTITTDAAGTVRVEYVYMPRKLSSDSDEPAMPEHLHGLLVTYAVARGHATADPSMQRRSNIYFQLYNEGKARARRNYGEPESYRLINTGW